MNFVKADWDDFFKDHLERYPARKTTTNKCPYKIALLHKTSKSCLQNITFNDIASTNTNFKNYKKHKTNST